MIVSMSHGHTPLQLRSMWAELPMMHCALIHSAAWWRCHGTLCMPLDEICFAPKYLYWNRTQIEYNIEILVYLNETMCWLSGQKDITDFGGKICNDILLQLSFKRVFVSWNSRHIMNSLCFIWLSAVVQNWQILYI